MVGLAFEDHALPPEVVIVVHARQPFDLDGIARQAKAHPEKRTDRTIYGTHTGHLPEFFWWKAADRVLVATIQRAILGVCPLQPRAGIGHLRPALASVVRERIDENACDWFAATSDKWDQYLRPYTILPFTPLQGRTDLIKPADAFGPSRCRSPMTRNDRWTFKLPSNQPTPGPHCGSLSPTALRTSRSRCWGPRNGPG